MSELAERAELIVVSPMRRTLQTALLGLDWLVEKGVPLRPDAGWQGMFRSLQFRARVLFSFSCFLFLVLHFEFHALLWYLRPTCEPATCLLSPLLLSPAGADRPLPSVRRLAMPAMDRSRDFPSVQHAASLPLSIRRLFPLRVVLRLENGPGGLHADEPRGPSSV